MNRLMTRLLTFAAALTLFAACDDGGAADPTPPVADAGAPDDPVVPDVSLGLAEDARACEVMILDPEQQVQVVFAAGVEGRSLRRGDRLAVAFAHRADAPFAAGAVAFASGEDPDGATIEAGTCFDGDGRPLAESGLALDAI